MPISTATPIGLEADMPAPEPALVQVLHNLMNFSRLTQLVVELVLPLKPALVACQLARSCNHGGTVGYQDAAADRETLSAHLAACCSEACYRTIAHNLTRSVPSLASAIRTIGRWVPRTRRRCTFDYLEPLIHATASVLCAYRHQHRQK